MAYINGKEILFSANITTDDIPASFADGTIKSAVVKEGATKIKNNLFQTFTSLKTVTIPASVKSIGMSAFEGCESLTSVIFAEGSKLLEIGNRAFYCCSSLAAVTIPASVTSIGGVAFYYCGELKSVTMKSATPPNIGVDLFTLAHSDLVIYVPYSADHSILNAYKAATNWSSYANIMVESEETALTQ